VTKGIAGTILEAGAKVVGRATGVVLSDRRGQEALARAVGMAQRGLQVFEAIQERALHAAGLAAKPDYQELRKQVARLKRKARELTDKIEAAERAPERAAQGTRSREFDLDTDSPRSAEGAMSAGNGADDVEGDVERSGEG
jgi:hypothetical protein